MEETREETPQDLRNLALKVAGLLEEAGQHALHDQLNPRNLAQPSTENADRGPRYKLEVDNKIMRFMSARIADIAHFDGFWTTRPAESRPGQRYWYIGKIDGVINYVRRMSEWTVTAALFEFGPDNEPKPIIGIVHAPALGLTYLAARGAGAVRIHKTAVGEKRDKVVFKSGWRISHSAVNGRFHLPVIVLAHDDPQANRWVVSMSCARLAEYCAVRLSRDRNRSAALPVHTMLLERFTATAVWSDCASVAARWTDTRSRLRCTAAWQGQVP